MTMYNEKGIPISNIEKHSYWVKTDLDKLINETITGDEVLSFNQIKNKIFEKLIDNISKGTSLNSRLLELKEKGVLGSKTKETKVELFFLKKVEE